MVKKIYLVILKKEITYFIATRDVEFIQHENHFNETMKLVDTLRVEAQAFRDQVAGIKKK